MFPHHDEIVRTVPHHAGYLTLAELEASTDGFADARGEHAVWAAGASRAGRPIRCLEIPGGPLRAVLVGVPHPEEPAGALALEHLVPALAGGLAAELGFSFSVVKVADPDGLALNEPWFAEPYDLAGYLLRAHRPAFADQFEWTFPVEYKGYAFTRPLPEAAAVMAVVDRAPVDFYMGLHNAAFSGAYAYISAADRALCAELAAAVAAAGLPPHRGEPEMPYAELLGDAVYRAFSLADDYEFYEANGVAPAAVISSGTSSDAYAEAVWDCFTLVAEAPLFTSDRIADTTPAGLSRREAKLRGIELEREHAARLHERYVRVAPLLSRGSPWQRSVYEYLAGAADDLRAERRFVEADPAFDREATVAELFDSVHLRELAALARLGRFAAMLAAEPEREETLEELRGEAEAEVRGRSTGLAAAGELHAVPLRAVVQYQIAALLCGLVATRDRYRPARPRPAARRS